MNNDIRSWLNNIGLDQYTSIFEENKIGLDILRDLTDDELKELGVVLGDRKRLQKALQTLPEETVSETGVETADAERRQLTVMFCDLIGSTNLSNQVDPEELNSIMGSFERCCKQAVTKYGGGIARFMGDAVLVYFGYPSAHENDPENAVRAGLEAIQSVSSLTFESGIKLQTRVGIATGQVVVGELIGEGDSKERRAAGPTLNLANRLEGMADPNSVFISDTTRRLVGALFIYSDKGQHEPKGFEGEPVRVWRVDQEADIQSRFEATREGTQATSLLGRETEINELVERWANTREGEGQVATMLGEPGIGKSHTVLSLRSRIADDAHSVLHYFCVPHQKKTAMFPVVTQLERMSGITRNEKPATKLRKLEAMLSSVPGDQAVLVPLYADLMGIDLDKRYTPLNLSPRMQKERMLETLVAHLKYYSQQKPVLMIFEDLHWVDPTSLEFIQNIIENLAEMPLFLLTTGRPEFTPSWPDADNVGLLQLNRLGDDHVIRLIYQVTKGKLLPDKVVRKIMEKTDGVPLFVEELTKTLLESGVLVELEEEYQLEGALPDHAVPSTLQDSLMARLDRQGPGKKVAQIGAAIGRTFSHDLLSRVSSYDADKLNLALDGLTDAGLVYRNGKAPHVTYIFKHALIQDAAYSTLLKESRRELHGVIANTLQLYYPEYSKQQPQLLAHHFTHAGEFANAIRYRERAARKSTDRAAHEEAKKHIDQALGLLEKISDDNERRGLELGLQVVRGVALESTEGYGAAEVEKTYDRAREICEQLDYKDELVPVLLGLYVFNLVRGEYLRAQALATRCVTISKDTNRLDCLIESYAALGYIQCHVGDFTSAEKSLNDCISLYESFTDGDDFPNITAQDPCTTSLSMLSIVQWQLGKINASEEAIKKALNLADQLDRPINIALVHTHAAEYYHMRRDYQLALYHANKGIRVAGEHGIDSWYLCSLMHAGITQATQEASNQGIETALQGLQMWKGAGARSNFSYFKSRTAWCLYIADRQEEAWALLSEAFGDCEYSKDYLVLCMLHQLRGDMLLSGSYRDLDAAEKNYLKCIGFAQKQGARLSELRATTSLHKLRMDSRQNNETATALAELVQWFPKDSDVPDLIDAREVLNSTGNVGASTG